MSGTAWLYEHLEPTHRISHLDGTFCNVHADKLIFWGTASYVDVASSHAASPGLTVDGQDINVHSGWNGVAVCRWILEQSDERFLTEWKKLMPLEFQDARSPPFSPSPKETLEDPRVDF